MEKKGKHIYQFKKVFNKNLTKFLPIKVKSNI